MNKNEQELNGVKIMTVWAATLLCGIIFSIILTTNIREDIDSRFGWTITILGTYFVFDAFLRLWVKGNPSFAKFIFRQSSNFYSRPIEQAEDVMQAAKNFGDSTQDQRTIYYYLIIIGELILGFGLFGLIIYLNYFIFKK